MLELNAAGAKMTAELNVLEGPLETCSLEPLTGFTRNGSCASGPRDAGSHTVCAEVTREFLEHSRAHGNDLTTPVPGYGFSGTSVEPGRG